MFGGIGQSLIRKYALAVKARLDSEDAYEKINASEVVQNNIVAWTLAAKKALGARSANPSDIKVMDIFDVDEKKSMSPATFVAFVH